MLDGRMDGAKEAVYTVLDTLNPNDKVAIVGFSDRITLPNDYPAETRTCYKEEMALATPLNINYLKDWIRGIIPNGGTQYNPALKLAFDYFDTAFNESLNMERKRVMLFLSDGEPSDDHSSFFRTIVNRNSNLNMSIVIMTYAIGPSIGTELLEAIAMQDGSDYGIDNEPESHEGEFFEIQDFDKLR